MSTPLHDLDVLRSLAEGPPGVGRDWANLGLALRAPSLVRHLPEDPYDAALVMASGAEACRGAVREGLRGAETSELTGVLAEQLSAFGLAPVDEAEAWHAPLREAVRGDGEVRDLYLAQLLAELGGLDGDTLGAASRVDHDDAKLGLPPLVVRYATAHGAGRATAEAVVGQLAGTEVAKAPHLAANALALVGVPHLHLHAHGDDDAGLARQVAELMGVADAPRVRAKGSARRRAQKWVRELVGDQDTAAAHLLHALAKHELGPPEVWIGAAVWLHLRDPSLAPVDAVLQQHAGEDRALLAAARRAVDGDHVDATRAALASHALELAPPTLFVADLTREGVDAAWLDLLMERFRRAPGVDLRHDLVTTLIFGRSPDRVAQLLADRSTRDAALLFARLTATEEVLAALLDMPVPADAHPRVLYAQALAEMGSPAVAPVLAGLRDLPGVDPEIVAACQRAEAILGSPLA